MNMRDVLDIVVGVAAFTLFVLGAICAGTFFVKGDPLDGMRALILFAVVLLCRGYFDDNRR